MIITYYQVYVLFDPYGDLTSQPTKEVLGNFKKEEDAIKLKNEWIKKKKEYFENDCKEKDQTFHGKYVYWRGYDQDPFIKRKQVKIN